MKNIKKLTLVSSLIILLGGCNFQFPVYQNTSSNKNTTSSISTVINELDSSTKVSSSKTSSSTKEEISSKVSSSSSSSSTNVAVERTLTINPSNFNKLNQLELDCVVENVEYPDEFTFNSSAIMKSNKISNIKTIKIHAYSTYENLKVYNKYNGSGSALTASKETLSNAAKYTYNLNNSNEFYIVNSSTTHRTHVYSIEITYVGYAITPGNNTSSSSSNTPSYDYSSNQESTYSGTYYNSANLNLVDNALLKELRNLITNTHSKKTTYDELKKYMPQADKSLTNSGKLRLIYSCYEVSTSWDPDNSWNREHVWPKGNSWFNESGAGSDLHHLRPEDSKVNSTRSNLKFGEVTNGSEAKLNDGRGSNCYYNSTYFEPQDAAKGDAARIIFYLLTRYSESDSYSITKVAQSMDLLLKWHKLDPVDAWEINRNQVTYGIQGNRNPFIDHPYLADAIWG